MLICRLLSIAEALPYQGRSSHRRPLMMPNTAIIARIKSIEAKIVWNLLDFEGDLGGLGALGGIWGSSLGESTIGGKSSGDRNSAPSALPNRLQNPKSSINIKFHNHFCLDLDTYRCV